MNELTAELATQAVEGDAAAMRRILDALAGPFHALALRMLGNHADADDATQESLLRVATRLSTFDGRAKLSTWAWRVAVRCVVDVKRRQARLSFDVFEADLRDGLDPNAPMPDDQVLLQQVKIGCGRALLQCLDADHRVAYVFGEILEMDGPLAASILEIEPATFRKRLSRARTRVREALQRQCGVVNENAPCRCRARVARAQELDRLATQDRAGSVDVVDVTRLIRALPELDRAAAYYQSDPRPAPAAHLLQRVHHALGL